MTCAEVALSAASCLALDVGATKVDAAIVAREGVILSKKRLLVNEHREHLFDSIVGLINGLIGESDDPISAVGVGCAGPMTRHGELVSPLNIPQWRDFALRESLARELDLEVFVEGDAKALALAEGAFGAADPNGSYLSMVVSTGIGGALVLNGRLLDGDAGNAGHIGHLNVVNNGRLCACGSYGCLEAEASGGAIEDITGRPASQADPAVRRRSAELVGKAVGTLASVLDFSHCYVAGSVALGFGTEFFAEANKAARSYACLEYSTNLNIQESGLGSDGPILGASLVGFRGIDR